MPEKLTNSNIDKMKSSSKRHEVHDVALTNFFVRIQPSGHKTYYVRCGQRNIKIGSATVFTAIQAREIAREMLALSAQGIDPVKKTPKQTMRISNDMRLQTFINDYYALWVKVNRKSAEETLKLIHFRFKVLWNNRSARYSFMILRTSVWSNKQMVLSVQASIAEKQR